MINRFQKAFLGEVSPNKILIVGGSFPLGFSQPACFFCRGAIFRAHILNHADCLNPHPLQGNPIEVSVARIETAVVGYPRESCGKEKASNANSSAARPDQKESVGNLKFVV